MTTQWLISRNVAKTSEVDPDGFSFSHLHPVDLRIGGGIGFPGGDWDLPGDVPVQGHTQTRKAGDCQPFSIGSPEAQLMKYRGGMNDTVV